MKKIIIGIIILVNLLSALPLQAQNGKIRVLVVTGGHEYDKESFNAMFSDMSKFISFEIKEFPKAYEMFSSENIDKYDVLVFYHMWQSISEEQKKMLSDCIYNGKPLVVLHHSICAFDNWEEYTHIIGGKYFHQPSVLNRKEYPASSYKHDIHFLVKVLDSNHPVTLGLKDFEVFDETYKDFYVEPDVKPLLQTTESSSTPTIGWTKLYGKGHVVTIQIGHGTSTYENPNYRKLLLQAIEWVYSVK
jgi:uncharacterized protein